MGNNDQYKYRLYSSSLYYPATPQFISGDDFPNTGGFASLYSVTKDITEALISTGTTRAFKGVVWSERLWLDFDDYAEGYEAELVLKELGYEYDSYDSGGRGLHIGVLRSAGPSHLLPVADRKWVEETFPKADRSIYTHLHLFRLPGTKHDKTGRIKRFLRTNSGTTLVLPRVDTTAPAATERYLSNENARSVFECFRVMSNSTPVSEGERHHTLVKLTYALKDDAAVDRFAALWWLSQVNKLYVDRKPEEELEKIVGSIYE